MGVPPGSLSEGLVAQRPFHRGGDRRRAARVETGLGRDQVPQRLDVRDDRHGAARHGLGDRQAVTLEQRREAQELGRLVEAEHRLVGDLPGADDASGDALPPGHVQEVVHHQRGQVARR